MRTGHGILMLEFLPPISKRSALKNRLLISATGQDQDKAENQNSAHGSLLSFHGTRSVPTTEGQSLPVAFWASLTPKSSPVILYKAMIAAFRTGVSSLRFSFMARRAAAAALASGPIWPRESAACSRTSSYSSLRA